MDAPPSLSFSAGPAEKKAQELYEQAARQGNTKAQSNLGGMYGDGLIDGYLKGSNKTKQMANLCQKASEGDTTAQTQLQAHLSAKLKINTNEEKADLPRYTTASSKKPISKPEPRPTPTKHKSAPADSSSAPTQTDLAMPSATPRVMEEKSDFPPATPHHATVFGFPRRERNEPLPTLPASLPPAEPLTMAQLQEHLAQISQAQTALQQQVQTHSRNAQQTEKLNQRLTQAHMNHMDTVYRIEQLEMVQADARVAASEIKRIKDDPQLTAFYMTVKSLLRSWSSSTESADGGFVKKAEPGFVWSRRIQKAQQSLPKLHAVMQQAGDKMTFQLASPSADLNSFLRKVAPKALNTIGDAIPIAGLALQGLGALLQVYAKENQTACLNRSLHFLATLIHPELFFEQLARRMTLLQAEAITNLPEQVETPKHWLDRQYQKFTHWLASQRAQWPLTPAHLLAYWQGHQLLTRIFEGQLNYDAQDLPSQLLDACLHAMGIEILPAARLSDTSPVRPTVGSVSSTRVSNTPIPGTVASDASSSPTASQEAVTALEQQMEAIQRELETMRRRLPSHQIPDDGTEHTVGAHGQQQLFASRQAEPSVGQARASQQREALRDATITALVEKVTELEMKLADVSDETSQPGARQPQAQKRHYPSNSGRWSSCGSN